MDEQKNFEGIGSADFARERGRPQSVRNTGEAPVRGFICWESYPLDMPLYMDTHHNVKGVKAADVAKAHEKDLAVQGKHGVDYKSYWVDEKTGTIYCLVEAPNAEAAARVHKEAHGLVADEIHEVHQG
jgi:Protein of unknown function (DUF4242)